MSASRPSRSALALALMLSLGAAGAAAQAPPPVSTPQTFDIGPQTLGAALNEFARQSGRQLLFSTDAVDARTSRTLRGVMPPEDALRVMLQGTGLVFRVTPEQTILVERPGMVASLQADTAAQAPARGATHALDIAPQDLGAALRELGRVTGEQILFEESQVRGKTSLPLRGTLTAEEALQSLLRNSDLRSRRNAAGALQVETVEARRPVRTGDTGGTVEFDRVMVTANFREQALTDVPMSIGVVTQEDIERQGIQNIKDLSRVVPGMVVEEGGAGWNRTFLRGISNGNSLTSLVGIYVDDIPVAGASLAQPDLRLIDLMRVEVLRGPQGTLYGQGSAGGTIRLVTRQPQLDQFSGEVALSMYDTQKGDASQELTGVFNVPLVTDVLGMRLSGTFANYGGWVDQPAAGRKDINNQDQRDYNLRMLWRPTDRLAVKATAIRHRNDGDGIAAGIDEDYNVAFNDGDPLAQEYFHDDYDVYNLAATYEFDAFTLLASSSRMTADKRYAGLSQKLGGGVETFIADAFDNSATSHELRLTSADGGRLKWVLGAFRSDTTFDRLLNVDVYVSNTLVNAVSLPSRELSSSWSVYGDASYSVTDRLDLGAGVRYFRDDRSLPDGGPEFRDEFNSVDPRVYASFALTDSVRLYANVAKGFRSGGFTGDFDNVSYDPEKVWSYEAGLKGAHEQMRWEVAGYFSRYTNYQAFVQVSEIFGSLINAGDADVKGVDWQVAFDPDRALSLMIGGNINRGKLTKLAPGATSNAQGDRLDFIPDYTITASGEYRFDWSSNLPGFLRIDYSRIGPATITERTLGIIEVKTETVNLLNARLGIERGGWSLQLFAQNLLGDNSQESPQGAWGITSRPRPRTVGVRVGVEF